MNIEYLTKADIIRINIRTIDSHGGNFVPPDNLLHPSSLEYLVEAVQAELFGEPIYPSIPEKAAYYMYSIIANHVFQDGNKRTGLAGALVFLKLNGFDVNNKLNRLVSEATFPEMDHPLYEVTMQVASGVVSIDALRNWFLENTINNQ